MCSWNNAPLGNHSLRAVATDNQNAKATSSQINLKVIPGDITIKDSADAILFPNPNNGYFTLFLASPLEKNSNVTIISLDGKVIVKESMSAEGIIKHMDLTFIKPGIYVLILSSPEIIYTQKFIKE